MVSIKKNRRDNGVSLITLSILWNEANNIPLDEMNSQGEKTTRVCKIKSLLKV